MLTYADVSLTYADVSRQRDELQLRVNELADRLPEVERMWKEAAGMLTSSSRSHIWYIIINIETTTPKEKT